MNKKKLQALIFPNRVQPTGMHMLTIMDVNTYFKKRKGKKSNVKMETLRLMYGGEIYSAKTCFLAVTHRIAAHS